VVTSLWPVINDRAAGRRLGRHWWSPRPAPDSAPISAGRAYLEVVLVFAAFFGSGIIAAGLSLADHLPPNSGSWSTFAPAAFDEIGQAGIAATLVVLLSRNRGISRRGLGLDLPRKPDGTRAAGQTVRVAAWALVAFIAGSVITSALATGDYNAPTNLNAAFLFYSSTASLNAGVVEEMVVLGFVVVTLQQARRPLWELVLVGLVLRSSYHIYYGPGVIGILVWGSAFIWLFLRTRSLLPIIVVHFCWDLTVFLGSRWSWITLVALLVGLGLVVAAPITWLVERANRHTTPAPWVPYPPPGAVPGPVGPGGVPPWAAYPAPPGWRPDPWDQGRWRWWDGSRWTDSTA
jgi:membrane protease YdiL (CAAX protease family)